jgi:hypothetical protein
MYEPTQQFCNKQIDNVAFVFAYSVEILLHVSTLLGHHQAIITRIEYVNQYQNFHLNGFRSVIPVLQILSLVCNINTSVKIKF